MQKDYDIVLLGATGHTGRRCAQFIAKYGPKHRRWAIAGRSDARLKEVVDGLSEPAQSATLRPPREDEGSGTPAVENVGDFVRDPALLGELVKRTRLVLNAVGPFHYYGTPVVKACAENGVHYVDCTGEVPWVSQMRDEYHDKAHESGAIMIPQCGIDSVPSDILIWSLAKTAREKHDAGLQDAVNICREISMKPSGGTMSTTITLLESYPIKTVLSSMSPFALSPVARNPPRSLPPKNMVTLLTGMWSTHGFANLLETPLASADRSQVGLSWGLHDHGAFYGPNFNAGVFMQAPGKLSGFAMHWSLLAFQAAISVPFLRPLLKKAKFDPGAADKSNNRLWYQAIATVDLPPKSDGTREVVEAEFDWRGDGYYLTGVLMAQAAFILLEHDDVKESGAKGPPVTPACAPGIVTPSTLGDAFVDRIKDIGITFANSSSCKALP